MQFTDVVIYQFLLGKAACVYFCLVFQIRSQMTGLRCEAHSPIIFEGVPNEIKQKMKNGWQSTLYNVPPPYMRLDGGDRCTAGALNPPTREYPSSCQGVKRMVSNLKGGI